MSFLAPRHPPVSVLIALDRLANTCVWSSGDSWGDPDETLSARAGRLRYAHWTWRVLAVFLDRIQPFHTQLAEEHDKLRALHTLGVETEQQLADDRLVVDTIREQQEKSDKSSA